MRQLAHSLIKHQSINHSNNQLQISHKWQTFHKFVSVIFWEAQGDTFTNKNIQYSIIIHDFISFHSYFICSGLLYTYVQLWLQTLHVPILSQIHLPEKRKNTMTKVKDQFDSIPFFRLW